MSKQSDQKILRIGLVQNGKIVEERLMRSRTDVNVGQDFNKNDLVVPTGDLPETFPLFEVRDGRYLLNFTDKMQGRISAHGEVKGLEEFRRQGKAKKSEGRYSIRLSPSSRGRVQIGDATLLFQFVTPPPKRPQPVLPASMRGGWIKGLDRILVAVIALSAVLQAGFVIWVETQEWPEPKNLDQKALDRFVEVEKHEEEPEKPEPKKKKKKSDETKAVQEKAKAEPEPKAESDSQDQEEEESSPEEQAKKESERQRQMAKEVKNKTIIGELGHMSKDGEGSVADVLEEGAGKKSMDEAFEDSEGVTAGSGAEKSGLKTSGSSDADGSGEASGIGELDKTSGAEEASEGVETGEKKEEEVEANVDLKTPEEQAGTGTLDSSSVRDTISRYSSRIQRCYERQLKVNSNASGKVIVNFTVGRAGRVTQSKSTTDSVGGGVGSCVAQVIKGLRFPRPKGGEVMINKTFVFEAGN